jgi:hypothetical protein
VSNLGAVQFEHHYDRGLLDAIKAKALALKEEHAHQKHLDLTFITGADRLIPEINELMHEKQRVERLSDFAGTRLEPYPLSIIGSPVTYMGVSDKDGTVDWHCDGVPVTERILLENSEPLIGGELEIYMGPWERGKSMIDRGITPDEQDIMRIKHKPGYSTLGHFLGALHRTRPIQFGHRLTLVLNLRSVERSFVDDNRLFYLVADTDQEDEWVKEIASDVWNNQLPAYRRAEAQKGHSSKGHSSNDNSMAKSLVAIDTKARSSW